MADFMDFNAWRDLAAASEGEVMQRQLADVESTTRAANAALQRAQRDAGQARIGESKTGLASTTLSSVGSYGDYLKAKQAQANAQAVLSAKVGGELGDVRFATGSGYRRQGQGMTEGLQAREARAGEEDASLLAGTNRWTEYWKEEARKKEEAAAERKKTDDEYRANYLGSLVGGARGRAGAGGTQLDYVGGYNPYADSSWAQSQGGWEAQQARNAGASDDQVRDIWGAYTAKGRFGQGQNRHQNMEREMNPWKVGS